MKNNKYILIIENVLWNSMVDIQIV